MPIEYQLETRTRHYDKWLVYLLVQTVGVSAATGDGLPEFFTAVSNAADEYERSNTLPSVVCFALSMLNRNVTEHVWLSGYRAFIQQTWVWVLLKPTWIFGGLRKVFWPKLLQISRILIITLCFSGHFPGEAELAGFIEAKDGGSCSDNWSYKSCEAPVKSSPPTNQ